MSRSSKNKNTVPKITEAQYAEYISSLKGSTSVAAPPAQPALRPMTTPTNGSMGKDNRIQ